MTAPLAAVLVAMSSSFSHAFAPTLGAAHGIAHDVARDVALDVARDVALDVTVARRGGAADITAATVIADERAVEIRNAKGSEFIPWDEVRAFVGVPQLSGALARSPAESLTAQLALGEDLWRARIRVARGDYDLARPLLAKHWPQLRALDGPTASLAAEAMLLCALHQDDLGAAVVPWMEVLRHRAAGQPLRFSADASSIDAQTGLLGALSPFAPAAQRAEILTACRNAHSASQDSAQGNANAAESEARAVAALMERLVIAADGGALGARASASNASNAQRTTQSAALNTAMSTQSVLSLLDAIVSASDLAARNKAVAEFDRAMPEVPPFLAAWRLAAIGTSAARAARATSGDARTNALERAAIEMLNVPAAAIDRTGLVDEYALEIAEALLRESGDVASADQLASMRSNGANSERSERSRSSATTSSTSSSTPSSTPSSTTRSFAAPFAHSSFRSSSTLVVSRTTHPKIA